jgi:hypothetical protein
MSSRHLDHPGKQACTLQAGKCLEQKIRWKILALPSFVDATKNDMYFYKKVAGESMNPRATRTDPEDKVLRGNLLPAYLLYLDTTLH